MRKPAGVIVAAVVLGLMTAFGLLGALFLVIGMFFMHSPAVPMGAVPHGYRGFLAILDLIFLCFFAFCAWTVVGLFRLRTWARYSVIVLGVLTALFFGGMSVLILFVSKFAQGLAAASGPAPAHLGVVFVAISLFYAAIALIGVWWVVYFNLQHVRQVFAGVRMPAGGIQVEGAAAPVPSEYGPWRIVVIVLAVFMLIGGVELFAMGLLHLPLYLFGFVISGKAALPMALLMATIAFFIGIGLLRRNQAAYWTAIGWQVFGILSMAFLLLPSARLRLPAYQAQINQRFSMLPPMVPSYALLGPVLVIVVIFSSVIFLLFLYALLRCRRWYAPTPEL